MFIFTTLLVVGGMLIWALTENRLTSVWKEKYYDLFNVNSRQERELKKLKQEVNYYRNREEKQISK